MVTIGSSRGGRRVIRGLMTTATCLPSRIALVNGHIRPLVCTKRPFGYWESEGPESTNTTGERYE